MTAKSLKVTKRDVCACNAETKTNTNEQHNLFSVTMITEQQKHQLYQIHNFNATSVYTHVVFIRVVCALTSVEW